MKHTETAVVVHVTGSGAPDSQWLEVKGLNVSPPDGSHVTVSWDEPHRCDTMPPYVWLARGKDNAWWINAKEGKWPSMKITPRCPFCDQKLDA